MDSLAPEVTDILAPFEPPKGLKISLDAVTKVVMDNEPCFLLSEENRLSLSGKSMSRYQILRVVRNDKIVNAYIYLGPAKNFFANQIVIIGGVEDGNGGGEAFETVATLQAIAEDLRSRPPKLGFEPLPLQDMWQEHVDQKKRYKSKESTFGPGGQLVRA